ncbi:unnamed protein product [Spirodela intermedia]|uniref:Uncharacterized protein n=1 Tax=Spirodela intermedia TaxID=51605 RepID=A0A7I8LMM3_SPIIN|nr:unnamed protein product [Spirodela intermedia]
MWSSLQTWEHYLKVLYISFLLQKTLMWFSHYLRSAQGLSLHSLVESRVEDSEFVDSESGFFPNIKALWSQSHILFIFHIIVASNFE